MKARAVIEAETPKQFIMRMQQWELWFAERYLVIYKCPSKEAVLRITWHDEDSGFVDANLTVGVETDRPRFERACKFQINGASRGDIIASIKHWADEILK